MIPEQILTLPITFFALYINICTLFILTVIVSRQNYDCISQDGLVASKSSLNKIYMFFLCMVLAEGIGTLKLSVEIGLKFIPV